MIGTGRAALPPGAANRTSTQPAPPDRDHRTSTSRPSAAPSSHRSSGSRPEDKKRWPSRSGDRRHSPPLRRGEPRNARELLRQPRVRNVAKRQRICRTLAQETPDSGDIDRWRPLSPRDVPFGRRSIEQDPDIVPELRELVAVAAPLRLDAYVRQARHPPAQRVEEIGRDHELLLSRHPVAGAHEQLRRGKRVGRERRFDRQQKRLQQPQRAHVADEDRAARREQPRRRSSTSTRYRHWGSTGSPSYDDDVVRPAVSNSCATRPPRLARVGPVRDRRRTPSPAGPLSASRRAVDADVSLHVRRRRGIAAAPCRSRSRGPAARASARMRPTVGPTRSASLRRGSACGRSCWSSP